MDSHVAEPVTVRLSGDDGGSRASDLGEEKKFKNCQVDFFLKIFFAFNLTICDFCMRDDSLGFEDCRLATHLLNSYYSPPRLAHLLLLLASDAYQILVAKSWAKSDSMETMKLSKIICVACYII